MVTRSQKSPSPGHPNLWYGTVNSLTVRGRIGDRRRSQGNVPRCTVPVAGQLATPGSRCVLLVSGLKPARASEQAAFPVPRKS